MNDEIIDEVHSIKDAIGAKFNYNLRTLFEEIKRVEAEFQAKGITLISPPVNPADFPGSALQRGKAKKRNLNHNAPA